VTRGVSRRAFLGSSAGAAVAGAAASRFGLPAAGATEARVPFHGRHQAGIATPPPPALAFATFDLAARAHDAEALAGLVRRWSRAAARLTAGRALGPAAPPARAPADNGEALGLGPAGLTLTFGFGPSLFARIPGLAGREPRALAPLPAFHHDRLDPARSGGDLAVQACAADPVVAFHAVHMLTRLAVPVAGLRWSQRGFLPAGHGDTTPRNLMGHKDGTANPRPGTRAFDDTVWVDDPHEPAWMHDGTYLVVRRIRMDLAGWDDSSLDEQEATIGRRKESGAPLTGGDEHTAPDLRASRPDGTPVIPVDAHVRRAHPDLNHGARIFRRGYAFDDGVVVAPPPPGTDGPATPRPQLDAGLFFAAYVKDPHRYVTVQRSLDALDHLNEYVTHVGSALFAVPRGADPDGFVAADLFA
jgi:deferrochelatase/peroxidase EfeB